MRTKKSIINAIVATLASAVGMVLGFITQKVFLECLGLEYSGANGLFTNIMSMLSIVELGIGSAIVYNLYKPIAEDNKDQIISLMYFYRKCYRILAAVIFVLGLIVLPFVPLFVGENSIQESMYLLYFLALIDTVFSYLLSYKRSILMANQENYIVNLVHMGYLIFMNLFEIGLLFITKNYILYLVSRIIFRVLENLIITLIANKKYPYINSKNYEKLSKEIQTDIFTKVKGLFFHKIGGFIVGSTSYIVISTIRGLKDAGIYNNYYLIFNSISILLSQIFYSIVSSVGNLLVNEDEEKSYVVYEKLTLFNFWIYALCSVGLFAVLQPFITWWIGEKYLLPVYAVIWLAIYFYVQGMRKTINLFKEAAGIFYEDRRIPVLESIINLVCAIICVHFFGIAGVFMAGVISSLLLFLYSYPKYVYTKLFKRKYMDFILEQLKLFVIMIVMLGATYALISLVSVGNPLLQFIVNGIFVLIVVNLIFWILFRKTDEYNYFKWLLSSFFKKAKKS